MAEPISLRRMCSFPSLPIELLPSILEGLRIGQSSTLKRDLVACSEVSRRWREFALDPLFTELTLGFYDELIEGSEVIHDGENGTSRGVARPSYPTLSIFRDFLAAAPNIASRIHNITLACREYEIDDDEDSEPSVHYVSHAILLSVLAHMPKLRVLKLLNVELVGPADAIRQATRDHHLLRLVELHLRYRERCEAFATPVCLVDIGNIINMFESVERLFLGNVALRLSKSGRHIEVPSTSTLRSLALEDVVDLATVVKGFQASNALRTLETLNADFVSSFDLVALRTLLDLVRANLMHFSCAFASYHRDMALCSQSIELDALDLSRCHKLRTLTFNLVIFNEDTPEYDWNIMQWECAIRALSFLGPVPPSTPPLSITFTMDATPLQSGTIAEHILGLWYLIGSAEDEIIRLVERERRVDRVQIRICQWGDDIHRDYGPHIFPKLRTRGILVSS